MRPERADGVAGIVLAAGASQRMGRNKLFLELEGETLLRRAVGRAVAAGLSPVLVVLGYQAERALQEVTGMPCQPILNPDYVQGINVSVRAGVAAVPAQASAAVILLGDMPFVTTRMIATLVERFRESGAPLVVSEYAGVQAPPTLFDRALLDEFLGMEEEACTKRLVRRHLGAALVVRWPGETLTDLDLPSDYELVRTLTAAGRIPDAP
ncbi:MAG TPA: nucleotidyltransferase family protein [Candidatus Methylomirabilis sp.]|nr:nucleotidyltransferase family protein [Candidatus Methylomirabilis sp.]